MAEEVAHRGLRRYLLPGEIPVAEMRHHGIVLLKPALAVVGATILWLWLDISVSDANSGILNWLWVGWLAVFGWAGWRWIQWRHTRVIATDKRIVLFEGWINHKVSMMPLKKVTDMGYERSLLGRILGYGTFILESAGQDQALSKIADRLLDGEALDDLQRATLADAFHGDEALTAQLAESTKPANARDNFARCFRHPPARHHSNVRCVDDNFRFARANKINR